MGIRRSGSCKWVCSIVSVGFMLSVPVVAVGDGPATPAEILRSTYPSAVVLRPSAAREIGERLTHALSQCRDSHLACRLHYRQGVIYFKAGMMQDAETVFEALVTLSESPDLVRVCSLNMIGQIARLQGDNTAALGRFERLAELCEALVAKHPDDASLGAYRRLWRAALIGQAEIHEFHRDYAAGAAAYERLLNAGEHFEDARWLAHDGPFVLDRLSRLYLQMGNTAKYLELTASLAALHPAYERMPAVALERMCVDLLQHTGERFDVSGGAFQAPAHVVACLRRNPTAPWVPGALNAVEALCRKYRAAPDGALLDYHHAWMLDAAGRYDEAIQAAARVASIGDTEAVAEAQGAGPSYINELRKYAAVQQAIMLTEKAGYREALQRLASLLLDAEAEPHLSQLVESMTHCIQTLKREVSSHDIR